MSAKKIIPDLGKVVINLLDVTKLSYENESTYEFKWHSNFKSYTITVRHI